MCEQEVNSKKNEKKKSFLEKLIYIANAFQISFKYYCDIIFGQCYSLKYSGDKLSGICPEFAKISSIKSISADINRHYPDIAEVLVKTSYFFNAFPRALYFT